MALMKQYAVDHGAEGIRVSGVNAGGSHRAYDGSDDH